MSFSDERKNDLDLTLQERRISSVLSAAVMKAFTVSSLASFMTATSLKPSLLLTFTDVTVNKATGI